MIKAASVHRTARMWWKLSAASRDGHASLAVFIFLIVALHAWFLLRGQRARREIAKLLPRQVPGDDAWDPVTWVRRGSRVGAHTESMLRFVPG